MAEKEKKSEPTFGTTLVISFASADAILRSIRAVDNMAADAIASDDDFPLQAIKDYATKPAYKTTAEGKRIKVRGPLADSLEEYLKSFLRVGKVRWEAVLDENTAPLDRALNGTIWDADDPAAPLPPAHFRCRCRRVPIPGPIYK
jgi:hypothetical protein